MMKVCRDCPDNALPECGKGGCERRDAAIRDGKRRRDAVRAGNAENAAVVSVSIRGHKTKVGQI